MVSLLLRPPRAGGRLSRPARHFLDFEFPIFLSSFFGSFRADSLPCAFLRPLWELSKTKKPSPQRARASRYHLFSPVHCCPGLCVHQHGRAGYRRPPAAPKAQKLPGDFPASPAAALSANRAALLCRAGGYSSCSSLVDSFFLMIADFAPRVKPLFAPPVRRFSGFAAPGFPARFASGRFPPVSRSVRTSSGTSCPSSAMRTAPYWPRSLQAPHRRTPGKTGGIRAKSRCRSPC